MNPIDYIDIGEMLILFPLKVGIHIKILILVGTVPLRSNL